VNKTLVGEGDTMSSALPSIGSAKSLRDEGFSLFQQILNRVNLVGVSTQIAININIEKLFSRCLPYMKWTFDNAGLPVFVRVSVEGKATVEESRALWRELIGLKEWKSGMSVLIDNRELESMGSTGAQIVTEVSGFFLEKQDEIGPSCIAVVRKSSEFYSYSRQFEYSIRLRGSPVIVRNFTDEKSAIDWLEISEGMCSDESTAPSHIR